MKYAIAVFALIASLGLTYAVQAQQEPTTKPAKTAAVRGKVESVDGMVITVTSKKGETTVTTDANTTFTLDGQPATLADVKEGQRIQATPAEGTATQVKLTTGHKKKATTAPAAGGAT